MSWMRHDSNYTYIQKACILFLKKGMMPKHVAFIMDGNRRYAKKKSLQKVMGHKVGFEKLSETLEWCRDLNIIEVSVYAFSIYNFNRESDEVSYLMNMARDKFENLIDEKELLVKYNVCVRIIGNLSLLPSDIQEIAKQVMKLTFNHDRFHLNICLAYTSHDEIRHSINQIKWGIDQNLIVQSDISEDLISQCMYMRKSHKVDLMIRTSGESRLSDFLMWQSNDACVKFFDTYWPEFTIWQLFGAIFEYQRNYLLKNGSSFVRFFDNSIPISPPYSTTDNDDKSNRINTFLLKMEEKFNNWLFNDVQGYFLTN